MDIFGKGGLHLIIYTMIPTYFQWKYKHNYYSVLDNSKIFDMTLGEYEEYIYSELEMNAIDTVYVSPTIVFRDGEMIVLKKD